ncbi:MAG: hypothetical protein HZA02_03355 [Nitrospinae bacterium]|nr:hypothetical protein [Nitrospinota bacterium]
MNHTGISGKPKRYKETRRNFMAREYAIYTVYNQEEQKTYVALRLTKDENGLGSFSTVSRRPTPRSSGISRRRGWNRPRT